MPGDVAEAAGNAADQRAQEQRKSLESSLQRQISNNNFERQRQERDYRQERNGDNRPVESSDAGKRDNIEADSTFESGSNQFSDSIDGSFDQAFDREVGGIGDGDSFDRGSNDIGGDDSFDEEFDREFRRSRGTDREEREEGADDGTRPGSREEEMDEPEHDLGEEGMEEPEPEPEPASPAPENGEFASIQEFYHDAKEIGDAGPEGRGEAAEGVFDRLRENIDSLFDDAADKNKEIGEKIKDLKGQVDEAWDNGKQGIQNLKEGVQEAGEKVREAGEQTVQQIRDTVEKSRDMVGKAIQENPELTNALGRVMQRGMNPLWLAHPEAMTLVNGYDVLSNASNFNIPESLETMKSAYENYADEFARKGVIDDSDKKLSERLTDALEKPENADNKEALTFARDSAKDIEDAFDGLKKSFAGESEEARQEGIDQFKDATGRFADRSKEALEKFGPDLNGENSRSGDEKSFAETKDWIRERYESAGKEKAAPQRTGVQADKIMKQSKGLQKAREIGSKVAQGAKKAVKVSGEALVKTGVAGIAGAAALSNPWTAAAYIAVQIAIKTVKYTKSKVKGQQREVDNALSSEKGAGAKSQEAKGMSKRDTKKAEALERG